MKTKQTHMWSCVNMSACLNLYVYVHICYIAGVLVCLFVLGTHRILAKTAVVWQGVALSLNESVLVFVVIVCCYCCVEK